MKPVLIAAAAAFAMSASFAAHAEPGKGNGHDKGHHVGASVGGPPGLAKKAYGMPPGQAKKMWNRGERLPVSYLSTQYRVANPSQYQLSPAPYGYRWVAVNDRYYLAQTRTGAISQVVSALLR